jgi:hypothetical protein
MRPADEYDRRATAFLKKHGITYSRQVAVPQRCPEWGADNPRGDCAKCGTTHGTHYWVAFSAQGRNALAFDFWGSLHDRAENRHPGAYDVLACVNSDIYCPDTFEGFCSEYGYNEDSRQAESMYQRCSEFAAKLREFFTDEEQEELAEIS